MKITIEKYQHRLLSRLLRWTIDQSKEASSYGIEHVLHPFAIAELESLHKRIDPTAEPPKVVAVPKKSDTA